VCRYFTQLLRRNLTAGVNFYDWNRRTRGSYPYLYVKLIFGGCKNIDTVLYVNKTLLFGINKEGKVMPLQARCGPEGG